MKTAADGTLAPKARYVARGFQDPQKGTIATEAPTASRHLLRVLIASVPTMDFCMRSFDVKRAFLQGRHFDENEERIVVMIPPKEATEIPEMNTKSGQFWFLKKSVYGLCDASRRWFDNVRDILLSKLGFTPCVLDEAIFLHHHESTLDAVLLIHVDDFLLVSKREVADDIEKAINENFEIGHSARDSFDFLGWSLRSNENDVTLSQKGYSDKIAPISEDSMDDSTREKMRSLLGALQWAAQMRPDIAFSVSSLLGLPEYQLENIKQVNRIVTLLHAKPNAGFRFVPLHGPISLVAYSDGALANLHDHASQGGAVILMVDGKGNRNLAFFKTFRIKRVCRSSFASEVLSMVETIDCLYEVIAMMSILQVKIAKVNLFTDSKSIVEHVTALCLSLIHI